jgi:hypothetical protein
MLRGLPLRLCVHAHLARFHVLRCRLQVLGDPLEHGSKLDADTRRATHACYRVYVPSASAKAVISISCGFMDCCLPSIASTPLCMPVYK